MHHILDKTCLNHAPSRTPALTLHAVKKSRFISPVVVVNNILYRMIPYATLNLVLLHQPNMSMQTISDLHAHTHTAACMHTLSIQTMHRRLRCSCTSYTPSSHYPYDLLVHTFCSRTTIFIGSTCMLATIS